MPTQKPKTRPQPLRALDPAALVFSSEFWHCVRTGRMRSEAYKTHDRYIRRAGELAPKVNPSSVQWWFVMYGNRHLCNVPGKDEKAAIFNLSEVLGVSLEILEGCDQLRFDKMDRTGPDCKLHIPGMLFDDAAPVGRRAAKKFTKARKAR